MTGNDRDRLMELETSKLSGATDQVHCLVEVAFLCKGTTEHQPGKVVVDANQVQTVYKDVIFPVAPKSRVGIDRLVNAVCCMAFVHKGHLKELPQHIQAPTIFKGSVVKVAKIPNFVRDVGKIWDKSDLTSFDRNNESTFRGFECASSFLRFFFGNQ